MSIHKLVKLAASALLATMVICAVVFGIGVNSIRLGGPRDHVISEAQDLTADVAPPPLYVIEAYKEVLEDANVAGHHAEHLANLHRLRQEFDRSEQRWARSPFLSPETKAEVAGPSKRYAEQFWALVNDEVMPALDRGDRAAALAALQRLDRIFDLHRTAAEKLISEVAATAKQETDSADSFAATISWVLVAIGLLLVGGTLVSARMLMRRVVSPMGELAAATTRLANGEATLVPLQDRADELGDLAKAIEYFRRSAEERAERDAREATEKKVMVEALAASLTRMAHGDLRGLLDEEFDPEFGKISDNLNQAISALRTMVQAVVESATSIQDGAAGIADASADLSTRTQSNAAAIEETTAALAGVDQRVASSRDAAQSTAQSAERAKRAVELGLAKAQAAATTMEEVKAAAASVDEVMEALDKIAFQTRVLAMNAAIEAGAAGAAGKGFAVVAGLVSQLASRAETEAHEARQQLTATATRIADAVGSVSEVEREFAGIVAEVAAVTGLVEQLSQDAHAQAGAVAEISAAMRQMDVSTQQNAAMVEETSAAADALLTEAKSLVEQARTFRWDRRARNIPVAVDRRGNKGRTDNGSAWTSQPYLVAAE